MWQGNLARGREFGEVQEFVEKDSELVFGRPGQLSDRMAVAAAFGLYPLPHGHGTLHRAFVMATSNGHCHPSVSGEGGPSVTRKKRMTSSSAVHLSGAHESWQIHSWCQPTTIGWPAECSENE